MTLLREGHRHPTGGLNVTNNQRVRVRDIRGEGSKDASCNAGETVNIGAITTGVSRPDGAGDGPTCPLGPEVIRVDGQLTPPLLSSIPDIDSIPPSLRTFWSL